LPGFLLERNDSYEGNGADSLVSHRFVYFVVKRASLNVSIRYSLETKDYLFSVLSEMSWEEIPPFRKFENFHVLSLGMQLPESVSFARSKIQEVKVLEEFLQEFDRITFQLMAALWDIPETDYTLETRNSSTFTLIQQAVQHPAKIVKLRDQKAIFTVIGDDLVSPHFFSGSGLLTGRDSVQNLVRAMTLLQQGKGTDEEIVRWLKWKQHEVIANALDQGSPYVPGIKRDKVKKFRHDLILQLLERDIEKNPSELDSTHEYQLIKIENEVFVLEYLNDEGQRVSLDFSLSPNGDFIFCADEICHENYLNYWELMKAIGLKPRTL